jgi:putative tricarboxylic transport membrane protein
MVKSQPWREELAKRDWTDIFLAGDAFAKYIDSETQRIEGILRAVGLAT